MKRAAILDCDNNYSRGVAAVFKHVFNELGGKVVAETSVHQGETNMLPVLTAIARADPEILFLALYSPEAIPIVLQAGKMEALEHVVFFTPGSLVRDDFIKAVGKDGVGLYGCVGSAKLEGPANDRFILKYVKRYGEPPRTTFYGFAYDAVNLLLNAIDATAVKEEDGTLHIGRGALRDAIRETPVFEGLSGRIHCDEYGDCGSRRAVVMRFDDPAKGFEGFKSNIVHTFSLDEPAPSN